MYPPMNLIQNPKSKIQNCLVKKLRSGKLTIPEKEGNFEFIKTNVGVLLLVLNLLK